MIVNCIHIKVKPESIEAFVRISEKNRAATLNEKDCLRFDILQSREDSSEFMFYEVFASKEGATAHRETAHVKEWKSQAPEMIVSKAGKGYIPVAAEFPEK